MPIVICELGLFARQIYLQQSASFRVARTDVEGTLGWTGVWLAVAHDHNLSGRERWRLSTAKPLGDTTIALTRVLRKRGRQSGNLMARFYLRRETPGRN
jgi:hypothetical protein